MTDKLTEQTEAYVESENLLRNDEWQSLVLAQLEGIRQALLPKQPEVSILPERPPLTPPERVTEEIVPPLPKPKAATKPPTRKGARW